MSRRFIITVEPDDGSGSVYKKGFSLAGTAEEATLNLQSLMPLIKLIIEHIIVEHYNLYNVEDRVTIRGEQEYR